MSEVIRLAPFWAAVKAQLSTARMDAILGGAGRVYLVTDDYAAPEGAESSAWGRVVVVPTMTLWPEAEGGETYRWPVGWLVRAEAHDPGGRYDPNVALEAAQDEAAQRLHGWLPGAFSAAMIAEPVQRWSRPQPLPLWDATRGLWYNSAGFRTQAAPVPTAGG